MFWSRVQDAKSEEAATSSPVKFSSVKSSKDSKEDEEQAFVEEEQSLILEKVNDFLFDLFDANCMEEFQKIEAFEKKAFEDFVEMSSSPDEYSFRQQALHEEFMILFEELLSGFLSREGFTSEAFFEEMKQHVDYHDNESGGNYIVANEIADVITFYTTFQTWCDMMKEQVRSRSQFKGFRENLLEANQRDLVKDTSPKATEKEPLHRSHFSSMSSKTEK